MISFWSGRLSHEAGLASSSRLVDAAALYLTCTSAFVITRYCLIMRAHLLVLLPPSGENRY